ncbi:LysR family transcriptional regulator [Demequina sp. NBRC 110057]|uniref:LysR family transcriptional regulator n=1 Tax=Demequina sp. NBRC 110057 TaxID=1570346 RepID=UPI000A0068C3|nr:LysR family transcriptional regulator [Demequina sp. NBRC 110057]
MTEPSLEELRMLLAVQRQGSLTAAAEDLGVTQQAVSQRMRTLERRLGLNLLERSARGSTLTSHGRLIADWARGVIDQVEALTAAAAALREDRDAQLSVAASMTIAEHLMPRWLVAGRARGVQARLELAAVNSASVVDRIRAGEAELGFIESPDVPRRLASRAIGADEVVVVVAPGHPWSRRTRVGADEVARTALILREEGSGTRVTLERALAASGLTLAPPAAELSTTAAIRAVVMAGTGAAAVSELAVRDDLASGALVRVPVDGPPLTRHFTAVWDGSRALSPAGAGFLELATALGVGQ